MRCAIVLFAAFLGFFPSNVSPSPVPMPPGLLYKCKFQPGGCEGKDYDNWIPDDIFKCIFEGKLTITPTTVMYFSNDKIIITGPCFIQYVPKITVKFGEQIVLCNVDNSEIECRAPLFDTIGPVNVTVEHRGLTYEGQIDVTGIKWTEVLDFTPGVDDRVNMPYTLRWDPAKFGNTDLRLELRGFREDYRFDSNLNVVQKLVTAVRKESVPNTGTREMELLPDFPFPSNMEDNQGDAQNIKVIRYQLRLFPDDCAFKAIYFRIYRVSRFTCLAWHALQPNETEMETITEDLFQRSPCPQTVPTEHPATLQGYTQHEYCNPNNPFGAQFCNFAYQGARGCYKGQTGEDGRLAECCYGDDDNLLIGHPGGGSADFSDYQVSDFQHFIDDGVPYLSCCKLSQQCDKYYEKRPSINSVESRTTTTTPAAPTTEEERVEETPEAPIEELTEAPVEETTKMEEVIEPTAEVEPHP